jgi:hypothetical protein
MDNNQIGELQRIMNTVDGRDFFYNFFLESCGVDFSVGVPSGIRNEYDSGLKKPAIDFFNLLVYHCPEKFKLMLDEQGRRRTNNG